MEDIRAYIESGVLELYVMGDLSDDERLDVERMAEKYPEIKKELADIEEAIEGYARAYAVNPADSLRDKILRAIPVVSDPVETKIVPLYPDKGNSIYKYAFAASVAILLVSWIALFNVYNNLQESKNQLVALQATNQKIAANANFIDKQLADSRQIVEVLTSADFKKIKLQGTKNAPSASILVAFNPKQKAVMIDMSTIHMPVNDSQHQYQLWALVDGKPVDLGVFDMASDSTGMKRMKEISNAQAFAVTLEPRGGSVNPTMEQMMVMGAI